MEVLLLKFLVEKYMRLYFALRVSRVAWLSHVTILVATLMAVFRSVMHRRFLHLFRNFLA